jgi:hypothetical protein
MIALQVGAIRVGDVDKKEALLQKKSLCQLIPLKQRGSISGFGLKLDEEVFLAQLALRAKLLNAEFQQEVARVVEAHGNHVNSSKRLLKLVDTNTCRVTTMACVFEEGLSNVEIHTAAPKTINRMREKLLKYAHPHPKSVWPFCANILDPVRVSIVCRGSSQILQVLAWFLEQQEYTGLPICRMKNKFSFPTERVPDGYRDLQICVLFQGSSGLSIIGEIQIHDLELHELKLKVV